LHELICFCAVVSAFGNGRALSLCGKGFAVAVAVGGNLTAGAKTGDFASITRLARAITEKIKEARSR
jgi:hypothetical protein